MPTYKPAEPRVGLQPIAEVSTTQKHPFGTIVRAVDDTYGEAEFMYVKGVSSGARGAWVGVNADDYTTTLATANGKYPLLGVMMSTLDAATDYGWVCITGKVPAKALASFADNGDVYLTGTAGSVDDAVVAGDLVFCAKGASALDGPETGFADFEIARPFTKDGLDDAII